MNYILGESRDQIKIECSNEFIDQDNEVRVIDKIIDVLNIEALGFIVGKNEATGRPMYNPRDLLKLYIYGYFNGTRSSRKLAKQAIINKEVIWLIKGVQPKYRVIADFRKDNVESLHKVFESFVDLCIEIGLYGKDLIAIDGTKIEASASKRKHYSKNKLVKMKKRVQDRINEYLHDLEKNDSIENCEDVKIMKEEIKKSIEKLEDKIKYYEEIEKELEEEQINEINFTDRDARTVKFGANQGTDVGYNIQSVVDSKNNLIVTYDVSNNSADQGQLYNMSTKAMDALAVDKIEVVADKGYFDTEDLKKCEENKITTYISKPQYANSIGDSRYFSNKFKYNPESNTYTCPEGKILACATKKNDVKERKYINFGACNKCKNKDKCTTTKKGRIINRKANEDIVEIVNKRTKENMNKYNQRKSMVEHPFGTIKRTMNFYYLLTRGFKNVRGEISMAFFSYNLKRVINIMGVSRLIEAID